MTCNIQIHYIMHQFICQIHIDPVLTLIINAPNVLPLSFYTTLFPVTCTGSISSHSPFSSRSPYSPIHQHATWTKDCYENKLSVTHKHLQKSCTNQHTYASYIFNLCECPLISKNTSLPVKYLLQALYKACEQCNSGAQTQ